MKHTALRRLLYAWARYVVAVDPAMLVLIEQLLHPSRRQRTDRMVRLPEHAVSW